MTRLCCPLTSHFARAWQKRWAHDSAYDENYGAQLGQVVGEMGTMVASTFLPGGVLGMAARLGAVTGPALSEGGFDRAEFEARTGEKLSDYERLASKGCRRCAGPA